MPGHTRAYWCVYATQGENTMGKSTLTAGAFVGAILVFVCVVGLGTASGQTAPAIAGSVKDSSGGVLPGATVEAASPVLIEKVRAAITDANGEYKIIDLRPGTYTVTVTLAGFNTFKREGVQLTSGFTAAVNATLGVGSV